MFKCELCNICAPAGTKAQRVVVKIRHRTYPAVKDKNGKIEKAPVGSEVEKEVLACQQCFENYQATPIVTSSETMLSQRV